MNAEGLALLRALILKMWALNEARSHQDCATIATEVSSWMPPGMKISAADVADALKGSGHPAVSVNLERLRETIDKTPTLFSARLNCDYQAILNEVARMPGLDGATLADVVEAMALRQPDTPSLVVAGAAKLVGMARIG
jgi:hypothetical protein